MKMLIFSMLAAAMLLLAGCAGGQPQGGTQAGGTGAGTGTTGGTTGGSTGLPNPASVYCGEKGGTLEIREGEGGQYGVCKFPNGSECEEWAYYRGECSPASTGEAGTGTSGGTTGGSTGGAGLPNPASVNCVDKGGSLEIKTDATGGQYGLCVFPSGAKCEEWALFREECSAEAPNYCEKDSDCACGKHITSGECFFGQKEFVNTAEQCPDFCTGIAAHLQIKCEQYKCKQVSSLKKCTDYTAENCPTNCVVCPPCEACSSISCQTGEFCASIGFNSTWYEETKPKEGTTPGMVD